MLLLSVARVAWAITPAPLQFEENKQQWPAAARYRAEAPGGVVWLRSTGFTYVWESTADRRQARHADSLARATKARPTASPLREHAVLVDFVGAAPAVLHPEHPAEAYANYLTGNDPRRWASRVRSCEAVRYAGLYPGVELRTYGTEAGFFEYDVVLAPGADPATVRLRYQGATTLALRPDGTLRIGTSVGEVREQRPVAYQLGAGGQRQPVPCRYRLRGNVLSFELPAGYDKMRKLVIDPVVQASTYTGIRAPSVGTAYDSAGNVYMLSSAESSSIVFPVTPGAYTSFATANILIAKFNAAGTQKLFSTIIGGRPGWNFSSVGDRPLLCKVDPADNLCIVAQCFSNDFPMLAGSYDTTPVGNKLVLAKLNPAGTALVASSYFGGTGELRQDINDISFDASGEVYLAGFTNDATFPTTPNAYRRTYAAGPNGEGYIAHFDANLRTLRWSTLLAAPAPTTLLQYVASVRVTATGQVYFAGRMGVGFPVPATAYSSVNSGGLVGSLSADGRQLLAATYLPGTGPLGPGQELFVGPMRVELDGAGNVAVLGRTFFGGVVPTPGALAFGVGAGYPAFQYFVGKLSAGLNNLLTLAVVANGTDFVNTNLQVDDCGNMYYILALQGIALSGNPTLNANVPPVTPIASGLSQPLDYSYYLGALSGDGRQLLFGTFYGSGSGGGTLSGAIDKRGRFYQVHNDFFQPGYQVLPNAYQTGPLPGPYYTNIVSIIDPELNLAPQASFTGTPLVVCPGQPVQFTNTSTRNGGFRWIFGDGSPADSLTANPIHRYTAVGTYRVRLRVRPAPGACTPADTTSQLVQVQALPARTLPARLALPCVPGPATLDAGPAGPYLWSTGATTRNIQVSASGRYSVQVGSGFCARRDTVTVLPSNPPQRALPQQVALCPNQPRLLDAGNPGSTYRWNTGATSQTISVNVAGTYSVAIRNPCGRTDTVRVQVAPAPTLQRDSLVCAGQVVLRVAAAEAGSTYRWSTGSTTPELTVDAPGTYSVQVSGPNCQFSLSTYAAPRPATLRVPNVFTPNPDDNLNPTFRIPGLPGGSELRVFNRWGREVYHSTDYRNDWAAPGLPDGVYYYLLQNPAFCQGSQLRGWVEVLR